jgi:hypothetical protein
MITLQNVFIAVALIGITWLIYCYWQEQRNKRKCARIKQLAFFISEALQLEADLNENNLSSKRHDDWVQSVNDYLSKNLGGSYMLRFNRYRGMRSTDNDSERAKISNAISGRLCRLIEFKAELSRTKFRKKSTQKLIRQPLQQAGKFGIIP